MNQNQNQNHVYSPEALKKYKQVGDLPKDKLLSLTGRPPSDKGGGPSCTEVDHVNIFMV